MCELQRTLKKSTNSQLQWMTSLPTDTPLTTVAETHLETAAGGDTKQPQHTVKGTVCSQGATQCS